VNGTEAKIEIFKPFGEAFELMKKILFQPFNLGKWCVIGFAAFLTGHFAGGGFNFPTRFGNFQPNRANQNINIPEDWKPWMPFVIAGLGLFVFIFIIVIMWLRSRGTFIFTDCIVRNRGAIAEPWREYRKEGNSYFLFALAIGFGAIVVFGLIGLGIFGVLVAISRTSGLPTTPAAAIFFVLLFIAWICIAIFFGVVSYFMAPVMYIHRCRAVDAFRRVGRLIWHNLGVFVLFCLFSIVLLLAMIVIGGIVTCATCCLAALPYVGTVVLLPVFVCLRSFGLLFIRQFGPDYDVWATLPQPKAPPLPA